MSVIGHWPTTIHRCNVCGKVNQHDLICRGTFVAVEVVPADQRGAVSLADEEWERVLWWLHTPIPPGAAKALDESIIRKINQQRGR